MPPRFTLAQKRLIRRCLIWCYKTTKEDFERIERKFTQLEVDEFLLNQLLTTSHSIPPLSKEKYLQEIEKFKEYKNKKKEEALAQKFLDQKKEAPHADSLYLKNRLEAVSKAIEHFLGKKELSAIAILYEQEMAQRILEAREHR